jgi:hypothetical protein
MEASLRRRRAARVRREGPHIAAHKQANQHKIERVQPPLSSRHEARCIDRMLWPAAI